VFGQHPVEQADFDPAKFDGGGAFSAPRHEVHPHQQTLDLPGLIGRAASASYVPKQGEGFERLKEWLTSLFESHRDQTGRITLRYRTDVFLIERT